MTSSMWIDAPTGVSGMGSLVARPGACSAEPAVAHRLRGLPVSAVVGGPRFGGPVVATAVSPIVPTERLTAPQHTTDLAQNDGTTLGIHSSGRPSS